MATDDAVHDICGDGSLLKRVIKAPADPSSATPGVGNKVKVHYTGTLMDGTKFDSSRDRDRPFEFVVGQGVIEGWSEAVPTMRIGEVASFTICAAKAYGSSGSPPTIPPAATLMFEIELLFFTDRDDINDDGSVLKKVINKTSLGGYKRPNAQCDVTFEISRDGIQTLEWAASATEAPLELPLELRSGLQSMKKGEKSSFLIEGEEYICTVVKWVENEECVEGVPGAVVKRTEKEPSEENSYKSPHDCDKVTVRGTVTVAGKVVCDFGSGEQSTTWELDERSLGNKLERSDGVSLEVCAGVEYVVKKMKLGEICTATIQAGEVFGYDENEVECRLELAGLVEEKKAWELLPEEKLAAVEAQKQLGNGHFKRGDLSRAVRRYSMAIDCGSSDHDLTKDQQELKVAMKVASDSARLNRAMCYLKLGQFPEAKVDCDEILKGDAANPKALFRRAKVLSEQGNWEAAKIDLKKLLGQDAKNTEARRALLEISKKEKALYAQQKALYAGKSLFGGKTSQSATVKPPPEEAASV